MKIIKVVCALGLGVFISACSEPQPRISKVYHEKWGDNLTELDIGHIRICTSTGNVVAATSSWLSCAFAFERLYFKANPGVAKTMEGTIIIEEDGRWEIYLADDVQQEVSFSDAATFLDLATTAFISAKTEKTKIESTWQQ